MVFLRWISWFLGSSEKGLGDDICVLLVFAIFPALWLGDIKKAQKMIGKGASDQKKKDAIDQIKDASD